MRYRATVEDDISSVGKMVSKSLTRPIWMLFTEPVLFLFCVSNGLPVFLIEKAYNLLLLDLDYLCMSLSITISISNDYLVNDQQLRNL
jgi:hypothetical protein